MQLIDKKDVLKKNISDFIRLHYSIGLVPTMGALHQGHLTLIRQSIAENDKTIVTIFVNPTQFNDKTDYQRYPRTFEADIKQLELLKCDMVFAPSEEEMYPQTDNRKFDIGHLGNIMEGIHRPGHFDGVIKIVTKLFDLIPADKAYFGEKDFQQLAVIKWLTDKFNYPVSIIACPTVRETDGLAMSSRNVLLSP